MIELASFETFTSTGLALLDQLAEIFGIVLNTIESHSRTEELLKQSQNMAQELQSQQEELQQTNEQLEEKAKLLAEQNSEVAEKNRQIEIARGALEEKAKQLTLTSKYKSEFLANMSHELRTPLNSLLILSKKLSDNQQGNLTDKQVDFAKTIHAAGSDLCALINDILDLSKIESGTVSVDISPVHLRTISVDLERMFRYMAESRGLSFIIDVVDNMPHILETDFKRLLQIFKNLLSNAFKFTEKGKVIFKAELVKYGWNVEHPVLSKAENVISFSVIDTGIGIPLDKQKIIFEAFQQVDGTTSRKYAGTGLGLSISRELAHLLGGEIRLVSEPDKGSIFTLYLPQSYMAPNATIKAKSPEDLNFVPTISLPNFAETAPIEYQKVQLEESEDDRYVLEPHDKIVLIIEDDNKFSKLLLELVRKKGFKGLVTGRGETAITLANLYKPQAITLDINLSDMNGWDVLKYLKGNPETYHIPVHVITVEEHTDRNLKWSTSSFNVKPISEESLVHILDEIRRNQDHNLQHMLIVEGNAESREKLIELAEKNNIKTTAVKNTKEALEFLKQDPSDSIDCIIMDLNPQDGFKLLKHLNNQAKYVNFPVIIYTNRELSKNEEKHLIKVTENISLKNIISKDQLLDDTVVFFNQAKTNLMITKNQMRDVKGKLEVEKILLGRTVLMVDDDPRNIFAIISALETYGLKTLVAENGKDAIQLLHTVPHIDVVLMDIMMPEMDGYETMAEIRKHDKFRGLPIIALTAKAMKGDREKCMNAGATDYISKPINIDHLALVLSEYLRSELEVEVA